MRRWLVRGVVTCLALSTGCAAGHSEERRTLLGRMSSEVAYKLPSEQVMEAARAVLVEQGYELNEPESTPFSLCTQVRINGSLDSIARWSKVLVIGRRRADGRFVVRAEEATWVTPGRADSHPGMASMNGPGKRGSEETSNYVAGIPFSPAKPVFSRALDVEWGILQHLEPRFAASVEHQVDIYLASNHPEL